MKKPFSQAITTAADVKSTTGYSWWTKVKHEITEGFSFFADRPQSAIQISGRDTKPKQIINTSYQKLPFGQKVTFWEPVLMTTNNQNPKPSHLQRSSLQQAAVLVFAVFRSTAALQSKHVDCCNLVHVAVTKAARQDQGAQFKRQSQITNHEPSSPVGEPKERAVATYQILYRVTRDIHCNAVSRVDSLELIWVVPRAKR